MNEELCANEQLNFTPNKLYLCLGQWIQKQKTYPQILVDPNDRKHIHSYFFISCIDT
jgi:hypothetical protein